MTRWRRDEGDGRARARLAFQPPPVAAALTVVGGAVVFSWTAWKAMNQKPEPCENCRGEGGFPFFVCESEGLVLSEDRRKMVKCKGCLGRGKMLCKQCGGQGYKNLWIG